MNPVSCRRAETGRFDVGVAATFWLGCMLVACMLIWRINAHSLIGYWYYFAAWGLFFAIFDRRELRSFAQAYLVNALLTTVYVMVQIHFYPDSYGCTSPLGAQTDDSYFFSLVADVIPKNLEVRSDFFLRADNFSALVRFITPFQVVHPLDVLFFLSGVAGMVCVYTKQFTVQLTSSKEAGRMAFLLCQFCPLLLMNGGAVFVRDTLVAALFMLSLCCINRKRYVAFGGCLALQYLLRPGTSMFILPLYGIIFLPDLSTIWRSTSQRRLFFLLLIGVVAAVAVVRWQVELAALFEREGIDLGEFRRTSLEDVLNEGNGQGAILWVQAQSNYLRLPLSALYMYLSPFLSIRGLLTSSGFDSRIFLMNDVYPFWVLPIHGWVLASVAVKLKQRSGIWAAAAAFFVGCFLVGVFSMQSRHKVLIQPLFYVLAASGFHFGDRKVVTMGYFLSAAWLFAQISHLGLS